MGFEGITAIASSNALTAKSAVDAKRAAEDKKIDKSAGEFESLLLSNWLQGAYQSFGAVPGSEDEENLNSGKEQYQAIAMQQLGSALTASGGIGIAKMISEHLHKAASREAGAALTPPPTAPVPVPLTEKLAKD